MSSGLYIATHTTWNVCEGDQVVASFDNPEDARAEVQRLRELHRTETEEETP
jgi:hypothetical protein